MSTTPAEPGAPGAASANGSHVPLDEVMLAMDIVDTLRHQRAVVEAELDGDERQRRFVARVKSIYESQGMEVSLEIIAEGVKALEEDRFTYEPPERSFAVRVAEVYVERGKWAKRLAIVGFLALVGWLAFAIPAHYRRLSRIEVFTRALQDLRSQTLTQDRRVTKLQGELADAKGQQVREQGPVAVATILAAATTKLDQAREALVGVRRHLDPGPDPQAYPDDQSLWDSVLAGHRQTVRGVTQDLGLVRGHLAAVGQIRSIPTRARAILAKLRGIEVEADVRQELRRLEIVIQAAVDTGDGTAAESQLLRLDRRVSSLIQEHQRHLRKTAALSTLVARLEGANLDAETKAEVEELETGAAKALQVRDYATADRDFVQLQALVALLNQAYELRIVSSPRKRSGVWRHPKGRRDTRNYYIIVEAIGRNRRPITLRVTNEENEHAYKMRSFGIRVPKEVYDLVGADKQDNGIVDNRLFGVKKRGARAPEYRFAVTGGRITRW